MKVKFNIIFSFLAIVAAFVPSCNSTYAAETIGYGDNIVMAGPGFQYPLREDFRDYHGNKFDFNVQYYRYLGNCFAAGIRAGYIIPDKGDIQLKYSNISFSPLLRYYPSFADHVVYCIGGVGFNFRKLEADVAYESGPDAGSLGINDFGPSLIIGAGAEVRLTGTIIIGLETTVDYIYDKETDRGAFGNTGGLNVLLNFGYLFH